MTATSTLPVGARAGGFTLAEVLVATTLLAVLMAAVWNTTEVATRTANAADAAAEAVTHCRRYVERISHLAVPAKLSTLQMPATADDVAASLATAVGEWIGAPGDAQWRSGVRFQAAAGTASMNAALSTSVRAVQFTLDAGESSNGTDDDGDGLVDEGTVSLLHDGSTVDVLRGVEACSVQLVDRLLAIRVRCGILRGGRLYRADLTQHLFVRNN